MSVEWLAGEQLGQEHGRQFRQILESGKTIAVPGAYDGMTAVLAKRTGFEALYLSGAALSASMAMPDLGMLTLDDVARRAREVVRASQLPLIVDCDTGFGESLNLMRAVRELEDIGAACIQIEDQVFPKKCGHLNDKAVVPLEDMCRKIVAAKKASKNLVVCARTDAGAASFEDAVVRAKAYVAAGADLIFVEALNTLDQMKEVRQRVSGPLLANMTEFGRTPPTALGEFAELGYQVVIYPVSVFRIMAKAASTFYSDLLNQGEVGASINNMMTRAELYDVIDYYGYEELDSKIAKTVL